MQINIVFQWELHAGKGLKLRQHRRGCEWNQENKYRWAVKMQKSKKEWKLPGKELESQMSSRRRNSIY